VTLNCRLELASRSFVQAYGKPRAFHAGLVATELPKKYDRRIMVRWLKVPTGTLK